MMEEIAATDAAWDACQSEYMAMQRRRINLVSELEEVGYAGDRLDALLATKLEDLGTALANATWLRDQYRSVRSELARNHPKSSLANDAASQNAMDLIHLMTSANFRIHPEDFDRLAALELARRDHEEAGMLILEALHGDPDKAMHARWHDWVVTNLPSTAMDHRWVIRQRCFGSPIRITGTNLDGSEIDTSK